MSVLLPSRHLGRDQRRAEGLSFGLGRAGICSLHPSLTTLIFDDSGSVTASGGTDPIGNRYGEAKAAFADLVGRCICRKCLGAVVHFDTPKGDVSPGLIDSKLFQRQLERTLQPPLGGAGSSFLLPALEKAEQFAALRPKHQARLVIFTDWALFDCDLSGLYDRLANFPGSVLAVALAGEAPDLGPTVRRLEIRHTDASGTVARVIFNELTRGRRGRPRERTTDLS